jgi:hypothetical protein
MIRSLRQGATQRLGLGHRCPAIFSAGRFPLFFACRAQLCKNITQLGAAIDGTEISRPTPAHLPSNRTKKRGMWHEHGFGEGDY